MCSASDPAPEPLAIQFCHYFINDFVARGWVWVVHLHVSMSVRDLIVTFVLVAAFAFVAFKKVDEKVFATNDVTHVR